MRYIIIISILLVSCSLHNRNNRVRNSRSFPKSDRYIQGNYSLYFGRGAIVSHNKVYEFSDSGECFSSGKPYGPDSHGNHPDYYGKYFIKQDTLHAYFYMYRSFSSIYDQNDYLTKDGAWLMTKVDTVNVDFYLKNKDSIIQLPLQKVDVVYKLNQDSLSFLPILTGEKLKHN